MSTASALAELAPETLDRLVITPAEDLHRAIADRAFRSPGAAPVRTVHDAISGAIYRGIRLGAGGAGRGATAALRLQERRTAARERRALPPAGGTGASAPPPQTPRAALAQSALNGLLGDLLEERGSELAIELALRHRGAVLPPERDALQAALGGAVTPDVVVFVHGLGETEHAWALGGRTTYAEVLAAHGWTPLHVRYNTGRHLSDNGRDLALLLCRLQMAWPVRIGRIALVGHSMGGLVARAAGHCGETLGHGWVRRTTHLVTLGTPHLGAPLEQLVHLAGHALAATPEARPIAQILRLRSVGIKDLRHGGISEEDWRDLDADALRAKERTHVAPLPGARHCVVAATLGTSPTGAFATWGGDGLVGHGSAVAEGLLELEADDLVHLPRVNHLQLLNHPDVHVLLRRWLTEEDGGSPA